MKFTEISVKNLKPRASKYYLREQHGFTICVYPSGIKTFFFIYTFDGERRMLKLGVYPHRTIAEARIKAGDAYEIVQNGGDPSRLAEEEKEERKKAPTVADLAEEYLKGWVRKKKAATSAALDERALNVDVLPKWKKKKARDIKTRDAILLLEEIADRAPGTAQYVKKVCRKMFAFALKREIVEYNPFAGVGKDDIPELEPNKRDRHLAKKEVKHFWHAVNSAPCDDETKRILRLILATAQRPGEVVGIRKSEIDGNWWTIPKERMKTKKPHRVYLTGFALSLLPEPEGDVYFPSPVSFRPGAEKIIPVTVRSLSHAVRRGDEPKAQGVKRDSKEREKFKYFGLPRWTPHDLRRTARTFMAEIGILERHAEVALSHYPKGIEGTYNLYAYDREKETAMKQWGEKLQELVK